MTVPELIDAVLASVRGQFYSDRDREFMRDRTALMKAIARWGHECQRREWHLDASFIARELCDLLNEIKRSGAKWGYLPVYLHGAVDRRIGQRAEELQAASRKMAPKLARIVSGVQRVEAVVTPSDTEVLARLYKDLASRQRARRDGIKRAVSKMSLRAGPKQQELL